VCGIAGIWSKGNKSIPEDYIRKMVDTLKHRGPDAEGIWDIPGLSLGHRRLKILDLSDAANQPFTDGRDVLIFNGEIYNYQAIKEQLTNFYSFTTRSDTEVLFRALQKWDKSALGKIDGQFAFAFYRASDRSLILARDRVGICPLYIYETEDEFFFSSEIKPILSIKKCSLDSKGIVDYFTYRYNIQNGRTLFSGIKRFPPAHFLKINLNTKEKYEKRYWRLNFNTYDRSENEIQREFNDIFDREVASQSYADVPVGLYLSGGIDSGALLSGFAKAKHDINSFTIRFSHDDKDFARAKELTDKFKAKSTIVDFSPEFFDPLEDIVYSLEEPFGDLIICANYLLAGLASQSVKAVLSGEGGDEAFCGYDHQRAFLKMQNMAQYPFFKLLINSYLKLSTPRLTQLLQSYPGEFGSEEQKRISEVFRKISNPAEAYIELVSLFNRSEITALFSQDFKNNCSIEPDTNPIIEIFESETDTYKSVMRAEIEQLTLIVNLLKQDRFAMRFSMEGRVPLVSHNVMEFAASLPYNKIISRINKNYLLNYTNSGIIKKAPFSLFSGKLFLETLVKLMDKHITRNIVHESNILSWPAIQHIRNKVVKGNILAVKKAMAILVFYVWYSVFREKGYIV
jgi:asparagine synthase (glutamine-hydrolysing)